MKAHIQHITAAVLLLAFGTTQAANVTMSSGSVYNGVALAGSSQYSFSADLLAALDTAKLATTAYGAGTVTVDNDTDNYYVQASASAPIAALTLDSSSGAILGTATSGGFTLTATSLIRDVIHTPAALTVTDLSIDLANKLVYGTISGMTGLTSLSARTEALWTIVSITSYPSAAGSGTYSIQLGDLTNEGLADFGQGLGLASLSKTTFGAVSSFGTITVTINPVAVPEPSTYALMGLGLVGVGSIARRHKKSAN